MDLRQTSKLFYQLKLVNQEMVTKFEKETGFSITRYELLMYLAEVGLCSQTTLQEKMKIDRAAITRHLKILEEENYVIRKRNDKNNREVFVQLTDEARKSLNICQNEHIDDPSLICLSKEEEETFLALLNKLVTGKRKI